MDKMAKSMATVRLKDMKTDKSRTIDSSSSCDDSDTDNMVATSMLPPPTQPTLQHQQSSDILSDDSTDPQLQQSTMWLGTEDGCVHVYNCTDNIRIKKNKTKLQHISAVYSIM